MTMTRKEVEAKLKSLEANRLKVWPTHNTNNRNQVAGIPPDGYAFCSKTDIAGHKEWLREVDVEDFDQTKYVEGTEPKRMKKKEKGGDE